MRSFIILLCAVVLYTTSVSAQKAIDIPISVKGAFASEYAKATKVKWEMEDGNYEASFTNNGQQMSVVYNNTGQMQEVEVPIAITALPAAAKKFAESKGHIKDASKITLSDKTVHFEAEVNGKDIIFDEKGNVIKGK
ncbi:MAG: PepSY-like domain-containing protein [Bacteroidota bacterium]